MMMEWIYIVDMCQLLNGYSIDTTSEAVVNEWAHLEVIHMTAQPSVV